MNINIYAKYDKIPNITYQDIQEKPKCYKQNAKYKKIPNQDMQEKKNSFQDLQRGISI